MMTKNLLLDTHIWIWLMNGDPILNAAIQKNIETSAHENQIFISAISIWEIAILNMKKRIILQQPTMKWIAQALNRPEINLIPLSPEIAVESCDLPGDFHGDPADRILVATARLENLTLVTKDEKIIQYGNQKLVKILK